MTLRERMEVRKQNLLALIWLDCYEWNIIEKGLSDEEAQERADQKLLEITAERMASS